MSVAYTIDSTTYYMNFPNIVAVTVQPVVQ